MSKIPKFEKRHFEYLATIIKEIEAMNEENIPNFKSAVIDTIIIRLKDTNEQFNEDKFREYIYA